MNAQYAVLAAALAAWLMVVAGVGKRRLDLRPPKAPRKPRRDRGRRPPRVRPS